MNDECGLVAAISAVVDIRGGDPGAVGTTIYDVVILFALGCAIDAYAAGIAVGRTRNHSIAGLFARPNPIAHACGNVTDAFLVGFALGCSGIAYTAGGAAGTNCAISAVGSGRPRPVGHTCGNLTIAAGFFSGMAYAAGGTVGTKTRRTGLFVGPFPVAHACGNLAVAAELFSGSAFAAADPFFVARDVGTYLFDELAVEAFGDDADALIVVPAGGGAIYVASLGTGRLFLDAGTALGFRRFFLDA